MPVIHVHVWEGFGKDRVEKVIRGIMQVFANLHVPEHAVEVIVHEIPRSHWGIGGEPASKRIPNPCE